MTDKPVDPGPDDLIRLIDRLNAYPVGLPDSPDIREFLSLFLAPEEILLASKFPLGETTAEELAGVLGWAPGKTLSLLDGMALKGAVVDFEIRGRRFWLLTPSVIGFVEFSLMKLHQGLPMRRLAELLDRYSETELWKEVFGSKTPLARAVVSSDIPVSSRAMTSVQVEALIRTAGRGALQTCYCRHKEHLLGRDCRKAGWEESCLCLGAAADFVIRRGFGRAAGADELVARVRELGRKGLFHITDNVRDNPSFVCNCCGCCCGLLAGIRRKGLPKSVAPTPFLASADPSRCSACGACARLCQIEAVSIGDKAVVDEARCLGCGTCLRACAKGALSLKDRPGWSAPPKNTVIKFVRIASEKGRLLPLLRHGLRSRLKGLAG